METTHLHLHTRFRTGEVDPRIFGGFLEHMGRAVYEGVYDPASRHADEHGFRTDVLEALRRLRFTAMRYPGGNFASGYHWMDGIGPLEKRPIVRELAWQSIEPNRVGTEEFIRLCRMQSWTPMLTVNLGTGTPEEARNWVEYCNSPAGTRYADMRAAGGSPSPHGVKLWCLGNEMDGPWQLGHVPADQYAIRAQQAAKMMKDVDASVELVACGSCAHTLPTYMEWDRTVLEHLGDLADYVSLHRYVGNRTDDTDDYLAVSASIDRQIEEMDAVCRFVQARRRSPKRAHLCFDEWNVWYKNREMDGAGRVAPHLVEEVYNLEDALVVAGFLNSFLRHADAVKIANLAQIVNVIAPLLTDGEQLLVQSIFHPFEMYAKRRHGSALQISVDGPVLQGRTNGAVPLVDHSAILDGSRLSVFLVNRSAGASAPVHIDVVDACISSVQSAEILTGTGPKAANSIAQPDLVRARDFDGCIVKAGTASVSLPPLSIAAVTVVLESPPTRG
jgi:alpha-N-arabinofuranosidase